MYTLDKLKKDPYLQEFIKQSDETILAQGYNEHGLRHISLVSKRARKIAKQLKLNEHDQELCAIAAYCHDIGNFLTRTNHHYFGATLFLNLFKDKYEPEDLAVIMQAIANHDKMEMKFSSKVSAIVVLADKSDVHRSRVHPKTKDDKHMRVNYATKKSSIDVDYKKKKIILNLSILASIDLMEYFEIFTDRMAYCRQAAEYLGYDFDLIINDFKLM